jgi:hypothetical protein
MCLWSRKNAYVSTVVSYGLAEGVHGRRPGGCGSFDKFTHSGDRIAEWL